METRGSGTRTRPKRTRKPLSDLTNVPSISSSSSLLRTITKSKPDEPKPSFRSSSDDVPAADESANVSGDSENPRDRHRGISADTSRSEEIVPDRDYTRRIEVKRKCKGKAIATEGAFSCPPVGRVRNIGDKLRLGNTDGGLHQSVPCPVKKHLMETRRSETRTRKPLSDVTNVPLISSSSLLKTNTKSNPHDPKSKPDEPKPSIDSSSDDVPAAKEPTIVSGDSENPRDQDQGISADTSWCEEVVPHQDFTGDYQLQCSIVYTRQSAVKRKCKGKAIATEGAFSCPPVGRVRNIRDKLRLGNNDGGLPQSVPCPDKKKQCCSMPEPEQKPIAPQDFLEKQRAYFAEIDAFELPEEVVSESELE